FHGARVYLSATEAWIDERAQSNGCDRSRLSSGDVAEKMRDHALWQVVRFDPIFDRQTLQLRHESPMPANHALDKPLMTEMIQPAVLAIALTACVDEREVAWAGISGILFCNEVVLERN